MGLERLRLDYAPWNPISPPYGYALDALLLPPEDHVRVGAEHCQTEQADGETFCVKDLLGAAAKDPCLGDRHPAPGVLPVALLLARLGLSAMSRETRPSTACIYHVPCIRIALGCCACVLSGYM